MGRTRRITSTSSQAHGAVSVRRIPLPAGTGTRRPLRLPRTSVRTASWLKTVHGHVGVAAATASQNGTRSDRPWSRLLNLGRVTTLVRTLESSEENSRNQRRMPFHHHHQPLVQRKARHLRRRGVVCTPKPLRPRPLRFRWGRIVVWSQAMVDRPPLKLFRVRLHLRARLRLGLSRVKGRVKH